MIDLRKGTAATRNFYNRIGWRRENGTIVDTLLIWLDGWSDLQNLDRQRKDHLLHAAGGPDLDGRSGLRRQTRGISGRIVREVHCGGFLEQPGLSEAAAALKNANVPFETVEADITSLPFDDGAFDVVYSSQAIYHIDTLMVRAAAFHEAMRVLRPGGRAIFVIGNAFPLRLPYRLTRRVAARRRD